MSVGTTPLREEGALAHRLGDLVHQLMVLANQRSAGDTLAIMGETGLSMPQMVALHALQRLGAHTVSAIADRLHLSRAATSHLVDRLVRVRLVIRKEDATDRRQKSVAITPAGVALLDRINQARNKEFTRVVSRLSPNLRKELEKVLGALIQELSQDLEGTRREVAKGS